MKIPQSILNPFGYTGIPVLSRDMLEDELAAAIQELADEIDRKSEGDRKRYMTIMNPFIKEAILATKKDTSTGHKWPY